jgi:hypothetical protein
LGIIANLKIKAVIPASKLLLCLPINNDENHINSFLSFEDRRFVFKKCLTGKSKFVFIPGVHAKPI